MLLRRFYIQENGKGDRPSPRNPKHKHRGRDSGPVNPLWRRPPTLLRVFEYEKTEKDKEKKSTNNRTRKAATNVDIQDANDWIPAPRTARGVKVDTSPFDNIPRIRVDPYSPIPKCLLNQ